MSEREVFTGKGGQFLLWFGLLLPPAAWAVQLETVYLTSGYGCRTGDFTANHLASIFALLAALVGGAAARRNWLEAGRAWRSDEAGAAARSRFLAILGMLTGALFALVIFAQWLPTLVGVPCDK